VILVDTGPIVAAINWRHFGVVQARHV